MVVKTSKPAHFDRIVPKMCFDDAYNKALQNPNSEYNTTGNNALFSVTASITRSGKHPKKRVLIFKSKGKESARAYECCWHHRTNCNKTYIDCYVFSPLTSASTATSTQPIIVLFLMVLR